MEIMPFVELTSTVKASIRRIMGSRHEHVRDESGQILVIAALSMVLMMVCVGLVVDVGHAMLVQRQLQAGADSAALAAAYELPDAANAQATGLQFSATPGKKNAVNTVNNANTTVQVVCKSGVPGCNRRDGGVNAVIVQSQSKVPTWFGRVIGITSMTVNATATACAPCVVKPLDVMIVLDRTGSMCQTGQPPVNDPNCTDMQNARDGVKTFLGFLDPTIDKVGLALFPPALDASWVNSCPSPNGYKPWQGTSNPQGPPNPDGQYFGYDAYWPYWVKDPNNPNRYPGNQTPSQYIIASMEGADGSPATDFLINDPSLGWILNPASNLVQRLNCMGGAGSTSYAQALAEAEHELQIHGRANVDDVIIFMSDGGANTWPHNMLTAAAGGDPAVSWMDDPNVGKNPCGMALTEANNIKSPTTTIYTIGYGLGLDDASSEPCRTPSMPSGHQGSATTEPDGLHAIATLQAMATAPVNFYNKPLPGQLDTIFTQIAMDLSASRGRLIDNAAPNLIGP
jgi:Flp pilus assembly protein TadG